MIKIDLSKIHVNADNYVALVKKTESVNFPMIADRMSRPVLANEVHDLIHDFIEFGRRADQLKRALFYDAVKTHDDGARVVDNSVSDRMKSVVMIRFLHSILGLITEPAELAEWYDSHVFDDKEIDWTKVSKEYGDCEWYFGVGVDIQQEFTGKSMAVILTDNIVKLALRYPEGFTEFHAQNRLADDV